ncbi:MAG: phospholipase D-like domain-containing protein [Flavobacteriales bacterium]|nr:phospholipase D-like domain-containing protein [Flavobacteriales bacterium]
MKNIYSILILLVSICGSPALAQVIDIDVARGMEIDDDVTVTGVVTNGDELGIIRYFQDGTGGLAAYGGEVEGVALGDSITVQGVLKDYNGLLELDPILQLENHGPAVVQIQPEEIAPTDISESYEAILVALETCVFADGGGTFAGGTTYNFTSNGIQNTMFVRNGHPLVGELIPVGSVDLTGIVSQFTFTGFGGYQLLLRTPEDISSPNPINIISSIDISDITSSGFTLNWITDLPASTEAFYTADIDGNNIEANFIGENNETTSHSLTFSNLDEGEVYFLRAFSVNQEDTALSNVFAAATASNTDGEILAYFNGGVDNSFAEPEENIAISTNVRDTIVAYIDRAQSSLDIAAYNINNQVVATAINDALDRGVTIRYIAEGDNTNVSLSSLDSSIPVLFRENATGSGMHNKFILVDYDSDQESYVLTGSTNLTNNNLFTDLNNLIILQDRALAKSFTIEFNEMWGSSGSEPNELESKFGADKINNTPRQFTIGGNKVELYFSPSDGTTNGIIDALETTDVSIDFSLLLLTQDALADKLIEKSDDFFIDVRGMINDVNYTGSDFQELLDAGVFVVEHTPEYSLHHKYAIVDHADLQSDPLVITGSHNWSASAETVNDENTLVVHDPAIVNQFFQEFIYEFNQLVLSTENRDLVNGLKVFPNPARDYAELLFNSTQSQTARLSVIDMQGKVVLQENFSTYAGENRMKINISALHRGVYIVSLSGDWGNVNKRLVVVD